MSFNELEALLRQDRSVRRFQQNREVERPLLERLVSLTRLCASGRNAQPLKYRPVYTPAECADLYPLLKWAGYYTDWDGPAEGERPAAYLVQCLDTEIAKDPLCDDGLQLQAITLGATALGLRGCIIKAFNAPALAELLGLPAHLEPRYVLALGYPAEEPLLEPLPPTGDFRYHRDAQGRHCVPKRPLADLLIP